MYVLFDKNEKKYVVGKKQGWPRDLILGDFSKAKIYKTKAAARLSANRGFPLSKNNGQQWYDVLKINFCKEEI